MTDSLLDSLDRQPQRQFPSPDLASPAELMRTYALPGLALATARGDEEPSTSCHGVLAADDPEKVGPRTIFQACSISKHLAAFGTLRLVDQGVLTLDEDIAHRLTSWRLPATDGVRPVITPRQLLAHTAGLTANWFRGYHRDGPVPTLRQVLDGSGQVNTPPVRPSLLPGSRFRYSGSHYAVLQQLLEDVTGTGFAELMRTLVLAPLGLSDSGFELDFPSRHTETVATGHLRDGTPVTGRWRVLPEQAAAGLWTTPADLVRLARETARALAGRSALLSAESAAQLTVPQVPGGFALGTETGPGRYGHTGGNIGYLCWLFTWPGSDTSVAMMTNSEGAEELLRTVLTAAQRKYTENVFTVDTPLRTGTYRLWAGYAVTVAGEPGAFTLTAPGQPSAPLIAQPDGRFLVRGTDCLVTPLDGALELTQEGLPQRAELSV